MIRVCLAGCAVVAALLWPSRPATALDVTCIEASRYQHLYQLFGGDRATFAAYFQIGANRLPQPEHCRAALVSGPIALNTGDLEKLIDVILRNQGWLADLYLSSGGGSIAEGVRLGFLVRAFWLKTRSVNLPKDRPLAYAPDFAVTPFVVNPPAPALPSPLPSAEGWQAFVTSARAPPLPLSTGTGCASACGLLHTAGVDRSGDVFVHRPRFSAAPEQHKGGPAPGASAPPAPNASSRIDISRSMAETDQGLRRSEALNVTFYQQMDAGADFIRTFQATSTLVTTPAMAARFPRFIADFLGAKCETDPEQLQRLDIQLRMTMEETAGRTLGLPVTTQPLRLALAAVRDRRIKAEQCVAAAHEKERLAAYDKVCAKGCDSAAVVALANGRWRELREKVDR